MMFIDIELTKSIFELSQSMPNFLVVFLASYLIWLLVALVLHISRKNRAQPFRLFLCALAAAGIAYAVNIIISFFFYRDRPFIDLGFDALIGTGHLDKSFPSDHAAVAWAMATSVFLRNKKSGLLLLVVALLISVGRVLAGVHYLSDILAGAGVGIICAVIIFFWLQSLSRKA